MISASKATRSCIGYLRVVNNGCDNVESMKITSSLSEVQMFDLSTIESN